MSNENDGVPIVAPEDEPVPSFNVYQDMVKIDLSPVDRVGGALPEPEERPAQRLLTTDFSVNLGSGPNDPNARPIGDLAHGAELAVKGQTSDFTGLEERCGNCKHWNQASFRRWWAGLIENLSDPNNKAVYDKHVLAVMTTGISDPSDPDAVNSTNACMGACFAYSGKGYEEVQFTHERGSCPEALVNHSGKRYFEWKNPSQAKAATAHRDKILNLAQGRSPDSGPKLVSIGGIPKENEP